MVMIEKDDVAKFELCSRLMDEGKYTDAPTQRSTNLSEFIVIMTSNLGSLEAAQETDPVKKKEIFSSTTTAGYNK